MRANTRVTGMGPGGDRRGLIYGRELRQALERERDRLERLVGALAAAERSLGESQGMESGQGGHEADAAADLAEEELDLSLERAERRRLTDVQEALERLDAGTYGVCERCGRAIGLGRLRALPWTRVCVACARAAGTRAARSAPGAPSSRE